MLHRKSFEKLDAAMAILVLFEQFLWQILLNILPLTLSPSPNMMHFFAHFRFVRALNVRIIVIKEIEIMEKLYSP